MRVRVGQIPSGSAGTVATIAEMFRLIKMGQVDPQIVAFAAQAIGNTSFKREKKLVSKATKAVLKRVQILEDPVRHEFVQEPAVTLQTGRGDCDDLVVLVASVLERMGFETELVVGSQTGGGASDFTHVWLRTFLPRAQQWLPVDPRGMLEFGWPVGKELGQLTALERFQFNEDTGEVIHGRSALGAPRMMKPQRRQRMGTPVIPRGGCIGEIIPVSPPAPDFAPIGPIEGEVLSRAAGSRRGGMGVMAIPRSQLEARRRVRTGIAGPQFPFIEERGAITGGAAAATSTISGQVIPLGDLPGSADQINQQIEVEGQQKKEAAIEKRNTLIQWLTIGTLGLALGKALKG